ncbi:MAG: iron ABC transporter permease [Rhodospirillaceae bacterium]|jgi:iron(III) transport system permease protein|nr:iron ABC transporter permease [Rhodospirillaceae bacterium]MBT5940200.1 iron ABC transporter permease [Rhodospirillaceae bacterium]MBT7265335.1 iron ABC transporter permease [Rhodospirillaceae bacterium]
MNVTQATAQIGSSTRSGLRSLSDGWTITSIIIAALVAIPIITVIGLALSPEENIWQHLVSTVLPRYVRTTLALMIGVGIGTLIIGVGTAWIVTTCKFPGRKIFEWALLLPLAIPAYVIAFLYTDVLEFAGPIQGMLRDMFGWSSPRDYWFPEIRSLGGAIIMMTLVLYPYVYMLARAAFLEQSFGVLEVSRTLGRGPWQSFFSVALPLARPAIVIGLSLVMMETLNDFGTVDFFAVGTLTLGIFDVWMNMNNVGGAAQIAVLMLFFVLLLIWAERFARRKQRFHHTTSRHKSMPRKAVSGWRLVGVLLACGLPLTFGFLLPVALLINGALGHFEEALGGDFLASASNSLMLSGLAALFALAVGVILAYGLRLRGGSFLTSITRFASLGYAIPGAVLAIGVIIPMAWLDNSIDALARQEFGVSTGLIMSGTIFALVFGYVVRFLALSVGAIEQSLGRITQNIDGVARTLGASPSNILLKVHLPIIRGSMLTAALLVFVDGMKELPMTVIMRPFNFETLATQVHQFAAAEQFGQAAPPALAIVVTGILPVILLSLAITHSRILSADIGEGEN